MSMPVPIRNCNRPLFGEEATVILRNVSKPYIVRALPRWLEQNYPNYNIVIVAPDSLYSITQLISKRYAVETTCSHAYLKSKCHILTDESKLSEIASPVVINCDSDSIPVPYFLDLVMMRIDYDGKVVCHSSVASTPNNPETTYQLQPSLLKPFDPMDSRKVCVYLPVMDREKDLTQSIDAWLAQTYENMQVVIIDYSSKKSIHDLICALAAQNRKSVGEDKEVVYIRVDDQSFFNISHAYNYAVSRTQSDVVSFACADSCPWDYYIEACMNYVDDQHFTQVHWGLHTMTRSNWERLNGHQEFIVGWGAEDDDFRNRANLMGLKTLLLPGRIVYQIPQQEYAKAQNRKVRNTSESALTNLSRFKAYNAQHGYVANYGLQVGSESPIEYQPPQTVDLQLKHLYCFKDRMDTVDGEKVNYDPTFNVYYVLTDRHLWINRPHSHFHVDKSAPIEKYFQIMNVENPMT